MGEGIWWRPHLCARRRGRSERLRLLLAGGCGGAGQALLMPAPVGGGARAAVECAAPGARRFSPKFNPKLRVRTAERTFQQGLWPSGLREGWRVRVRGGGGRRRRRRRSRRRSGATDGATITARGYARGNGRPICFKAIFFAFFFEISLRPCLRQARPVEPLQGRVTGCCMVSAERGLRGDMFVTRSGRAAKALRFSLNRGRTPRRRGRWVAAPRKGVQVPYGYVLPPRRPHHEIASPPSLPPAGPVNCVCPALPCATKRCSRRTARPRGYCAREA